MRFSFIYAVFNGSHFVFLLTMLFYIPKQLQSISIYDMIVSVEEYLLVLF